MINYDYIILFFVENVYLNVDLLKLLMLITKTIVIIDICLVVKGLRR